MAATGYEPLNTLKPVADDLWIIDGPAILHRKVPFPTRAVVIRLKGGALWVQSPTELTPELQAELNALGPVAHLIVPNRNHVSHLNAWQAAFPEARTCAPPGVVEWVAKRGGETLKVDAGIDRDASGADTPWGAEIDTLLVSGIRGFHEVVFFHRASRSLILADFIQALETANLPVRVRPRVWISGIDDVNATMPPSLRRLFLDKAALAEDIEQMIAWRPRRILLSHGRWFDSNGVGELQRAFGTILKQHRWTRISKGMSRMP